MSGFYGDNQNAGYQKASVGSVYPIYARGGSGALSRVEPLITVEEFKTDYLFGVRLYDAINKRHITDAELKRCLIRAMNAVEMSLNMTITPLHKELSSYLLIDYYSMLLVIWKFLLRPILSIDKMSIGVSR